MNHSFEKKIKSCLQTRTCGHARAKYDGMIAGPLKRSIILGTFEPSKIDSSLIYRLLLSNLDHLIPLSVRRQFCNFKFQIEYQNIRKFELLIILFPLLVETWVNIFFSKRAALLTLINLSMLKFVCQNIIAGAALTEKIKTCYHHFRLIEEITESFEMTGKCSRVSFNELKLFKNLTSR